MHTALNVNRNMKKMFLSSLEGESRRCEVRRALTPIHLPPFISLLQCLTPSLSLSISHMTHTHSTDDSFTCACADVENKTWMATVMEVYTRTFTPGLDLNV